MTNVFQYSILQYHHSQVLGESLNVGIAIHFPGERRLHFVAGDISRVKAAYPDFDSTLFHAITKSLRAKLEIVSTSDLFHVPKAFSFRDHLFTELIPPDDSALQFTEPVAAVNGFDTSEEAVEAYKRIFLPDTSEETVDGRRHSESYLVKKFTDRIIRRNIIIEHRMKRNPVIQARKVKLPFDLSWPNGTEHLVKAISFDLLTGRDIQDKSVRFFGYFNLLSEYAKLHKYTFDLLIAAPQDPVLQASFEDAVETLKSAEAPMELITEERIDEYSDETAEILHRKDL